MGPHTGPGPLEPGFPLQPKCPSSVLPSQLQPLCSWAAIVLLSLKSFTCEKMGLDLQGPLLQSLLLTYDLRVDFSLDYNVDIHLSIHIKKNLY